MELEQKAFEDSKNRMLSEFSAEKDRLLKEIHQKEHELEFQREKLLKDKKEMAEHLNREFNEKVRMIEKRNQVSHGLDVCCCFCLQQRNFFYLFIEFHFLCINFFQCDPCENLFFSLLMSMLNFPVNTDSNSIWQNIFPSKSN